MSVASATAPSSYTFTHIYSNGVKMTATFAADEATMVSFTGSIKDLSAEERMKADDKLRSFKLEKLKTSSKSDFLVRDALRVQGGDAVKKALGTDVAKLQEKYNISDQELSAKAMDMEERKKLKPIYDGELTKKDIRLMEKQQREGALAEVEISQPQVAAPASVAAAPVPVTIASTQAAAPVKTTPASTPTSTSTQLAQASSSSEWDLSKVPYQVKTVKQDVQAAFRKPAANNSERMMNVARAYDGVYESRKAGIDNPILAAGLKEVKETFGQRIDADKLGNVDNGWCDLFVNIVFADMYRLTGNPAFIAADGNYWTEYGHQVARANARRSDIAIMDKLNSRGEREKHIGFIDSGMENGGYWLVSGSNGDAVRREWVSASRITTIRRGDWDLNDGNRKTSDNVA